MTPTFKVIDKRTGREYSEKNINTDGLMDMDLDQMFLGEDGSLVMADDCNRIAYQDRERFDVVIDGYVSLERALEIIDGCKFKYKEDEVSAWDGIMWHNRALEQAKQAVLDLKGGTTKVMENYSIKMVTNAKEAEEYQIISEEISKRFEEFFKMMRGEQDEISD